MRVWNYLLRGAQSIEATPPLRAVICSGGIPDPAFSWQEVTLLFRHRRLILPSLSYRQGSPACRIRVIVATYQEFTYPAHAKLSRGNKRRQVSPCQVDVPVVFATRASDNRRAFAGEVRSYVPIETVRSQGRQTAAESRKWLKIQCACALRRRQTPVGYWKLGDHARRPVQTTSKEYGCDCSSLRT